MFKVDPPLYPTVGALTHCKRIPAKCGVSNNRDGASCASAPKSRCGPAVRHKSRHTERHLKMSLRGRIKPAEARRFAANVLNKAFHLVIKTPAKFGINPRVVICRRLVLLRRFRMEGVRSHRPTILRMRWLTILPGMA